MKIAIWLTLLFAPLLAATDIYQVQPRVSRTAVWVGDQINYAVRVEHAPGIEFVQDHLKKEELNLHPFDILGVSTSVGPLVNGHRYFELRLRLTLLEMSPAETVIPGFNLFYFSSASGPSADAGKTETPAEILAVPAFPVAVRSTLNDPSAGIREQKDVVPIRARTWILPLLAGLCGLAVVIGSAVWFAIIEIRSGAWKRRIAEQAHKQSFAESFEQVRGMRGESREELESFYNKASETLRRLAAEKLGDGAGLTGPEIETALRNAGANERQAASMGELLLQCDRIRYAPDGLELGREIRADFLRKFAELAEHRP